jgi:high-affinity iron transporter
MMAFLAVLREGFETAVFLLATFHASSNSAAGATGAVLGIALALVLGYGIYRGGRARIAALLPSTLRRCEI